MPSKAIGDLPLGIDKAGIRARGATMGSMIVGHETWPPGDYSDLFRGLPHDACRAEHWGYLLRGRFEIVTPEGTETVEAGQVYHIPPGHRFRVLEPSEMVEFTPKGRGYEETVAAWRKNFPVWLAAQAKR